MSQVARRPRERRGGRCGFRVCDLMALRMCFLTFHASFFSIHKNDNNYACHLCTSKERGRTNEVSVRALNFAEESSPDCTEHKAASCARALPGISLPLPRPPLAAGPCRSQPASPRPRLCHVPAACFPLPGHGGGGE